ncbi:MAG TPA: preprotein translocase subunit SecE [Terriglobales bacterium]|nr:preprotein translocase subunit SecE [Terriglobales bacterium]
MAKAATVPATSEGGLNAIKAWPQRIKLFYNDVRTEMKKVTTPTRKEVQATTAVVIIAVFLFGLYFWLVDTVIGRAMDQLLRYLIAR